MTALDMPVCAAPAALPDFTVDFDFADIFGDLFGFGGFGRSSTALAQRARAAAPICNIAWT